MKEHYLFSSSDLRKLIFPLVIEQLLSITVGMMDSIMIAGVGEAAVSAVSLVDSVMILLFNIFAALATGGAVVAGQYLGSKKKREACESADQLFLFSAVASVVVMALVYLGKNFILHGLFGKIEADVMAYCNTYLLIVSASIPFIALYNAGAALFRSMGNSKVSMYISFLMNTINICGNALLIYGFKMEIAGAAIPTLVSRIVAAVAICILLRKQELTIHLTKPFRWRFDGSKIKKILYIGIPNSLENSMFQLGKILLLSLVATFGTASITANAVSNTVALFQILPGMSINLAILTVASQCVGTGDYDQVTYYTKKLLKIIHIAMLAVNVVIIFAIPLILWLYRLSPETSAMTRQILLYHGVLCVFFWPPSFSLPNTLRAANDVRYSMIVSILSMWLCRIVFAYIFGLYFHMGVFGVWVAMTIDWVVRAAFFIGRYVSGKWKKYQV